MKKKYFSVFVTVVFLMVITTAFFGVATNDALSVTESVLLTTQSVTEETTVTLPVFIEETTTEEQATCPDNAHRYMNVTEKATCEADGKITTICERCGHISKERVINRISDIYFDNQGERFENNTEIEYDGNHHGFRIKVFDSKGYELDEYLQFNVTGKTSAYKTGTYKVTVTSASEQYDFSVTLTYRIVDPVITQPSSFTATTTKKGVKLAWDKCENVNGYDVYRKDSDSSEYKKIKTLTDENEFLDNNVVYNKEYSYKVKAFRYVGSKTLSSDGGEGVDVKAEYVITPSAPSFELTADGIKVIWNKVEGAGKYVIYRSASKNGTYSKIATVKAPDVTYNDKKTVLGKTYYYKIKVYTDNKASDFSAVNSIKANLPAPTINKNINATADSFTFSWKKLNKADGYFIYKTDGKKHTKVAEIKNNSTTSYTYKSKKLVKIVVTAYYKNSSGKKIQSDYSKIIYAKALAKPSIKLEVYGRGKNISVVSGVESNSYQVYYKVGKNGKWKLLEKGNKYFTHKTLTATHENVELNKNYYYRLRAMDVKNDNVIYGPYSETKQLILGYIPGVKVTLPNKNSTEMQSFSVTVKNNAKKTLRVHDFGYVFDNDNGVSGEIQGFFFDGHTFCDYIDISVGKTKTANFTPMDYIFTLEGMKYCTYKKTSDVVLYFKYDGLEYASVYNLKKGHVYK